MQDKTPKLDITKLTPEQRDKLDTWNTGQSQLQTLEDIASMAQEMLGIMDDNQKDPGRKTLIIDHVTGDDFVKILTNMQDSLQAFKEQKEPQLPDYATPVVNAISKLEKAVAAAMKATDAPAPVVNVPAPNVTVKPTPVDFSGVERILKTDLPKAFKESIKLIPSVDIPEQDDTAILEKLTEAIALLGDIDTGVRMKPQIGSVDVKKINNGQPLPTTEAAAAVPASVTLQNNVAANSNGATMDVGGYAVAMIQVVSSTAMSGGTTVNFEASLDNSNWTAIMAQGIGMGTLATTTTSDGDYRINIAGYVFLRARISGYSAGRTTIIGWMTPLSAQATLMPAIGNVASGTTDSGNPVKVAGVYNTSAPTLTNGQRGDLQLDSAANLKETLATLLAGENLATNRLNVEPIYSFTNITTAATTTPKSGAGTLHAITINTPVASATITIYDNTSAASTKIGTITLGGTLASDQTAFYLYDVSFNTGLTLVTSGATDITVSWR